MKIDDIRILSKAIDFYLNLGVTYIELPWLVPQKYSLVTKPPHKKDFFINGKVLVASGEQSFIEKMCKNELKKDVVYMGITPCFRDEHVDNLHKTYFSKLELFCVSDDEERYKLLLSYASMFFNQVMGVQFDIKDMGNSSKDITSKLNIELGSYLHHKEIIDGIEYKWSCGTGVALPRIYQAI